MTRQSFRRIMRQGLVGASLLAASAIAGAQVKIGVMVSSTGSGSIVGVPQKNTAQILPTSAGGTAISYIVLDDGGDPTATVNNVKKLLLEDKVDGLIGPSLSPCAMAILDFVGESKTPLVAAVGTDAVIEPMDAKRSWVFKTAQANTLIMRILVDRMQKEGVRTIGLMRLADALGEEWYKAMVPLIDKAGIKLVADERFQRSDTNVTAQTLHLMQAKPDAVLVAAAGGASVLANVSLRDKGYRGRIYQTNGAATDDFTKLGGKAVEGTEMVAGPLQVVDDLPASDPIKAVADQYIAQYQKVFGTKPSTFGANVYDAGLLYERAIPVAMRTAKPGTPEFRAALRNAIEQVRDLVGSQGVFNMSPTNHNGMDDRAARVMVVKDGKWRLADDVAR